VFAVLADRTATNTYNAINIIIVIIIIVVISLFLMKQHRHQIKQ